VVLRRFPGFIHGFIGAAGISRACRDAVIEIAGATRAMFAGSRWPEARTRAIEPAPTTA
jgi:hypothetical protein